MRRRWKYKVAAVFLHIYTRWFGRLSSRSSFDSAENFQRITVFSSTALGDFLLNTPAMKAIRRRYPDAEITLVASPKNRGLVENHTSGELYNHVLYWNNKLRTLRTLVKQLTATGPVDLTVILHSHGPYDVVAAITSGAKYIFYDNYCSHSISKINEYNHWVTNYLDCFYSGFIQRKLELVSILGAPKNDINMCLPFTVTPAITHPGNHVIGLQLGASKEEKTWPVSYYAELANSLLSMRNDLKIVLIGGQSESGLADEFLRSLSNEIKERVDNYIGKTDLRQLAEIISSMSLLVTGDTGPLHIAVALQVKTVSLFISTDPRDTGPCQDNQLHTTLVPAYHMLRIESEPFGVRGLIKPQEVLANIERVLF